ncbi:sialate O-acetylesterase [Pelomyxa schiedti]|nr:sialate O-acetylesterase [Pelomyxa schiedti]
MSPHRSGALPFLPSIIIIASLAALSALCACGVPPANDTAPPTNNTTSSYPTALLGNAFGSHMVVQGAPSRSRVYGHAASPNLEVEVYVDGQLAASATSGAAGAWSAWLPVTEPSLDSHSITVTDVAANHSQTIDDVLFGDVYLCSGQSNMEMTLCEAFNQTLLRTDNYPNIRIMTIGQGNYSFQPVDDFISIKHPWDRASPGSLGIGGNKKMKDCFSAVCWFFGQKIHTQYSIPVGLISANWGGSYIESWSSPDALEQCDCNNLDVNKVPNYPSLLWNTMITPLLQMGLRSVIWYQAEANCWNWQCYTCSFVAMINDLREKRGDTPQSLPFIFVQLHPWTQYAVGMNLPEMRLAQTPAVELVNVGMASAVDLGDWKSPLGNVHPRDKLDVGKRLALVADHLIYGNKSVVINGPTFEQMVVEKGGLNASAMILYETTSIGSGLVLSHSDCPSGALPEDCRFSAELKSSDGQWLEATITQVDSTTVRLSCSMEPNETIVGARYLYAPWPLCTIFNKEGLPATPFRYEMDHGFRPGPCLLSMLLVLLSLVFLM